jgi:hypothetical protein
VVERLRLADGTEVVRKVICRDRPAVVPHWPAGRDPSHWNHWRREVDAFDSGFTRSFAAHGLAAPELVGRASPADGVEVLFTTFVDGPSGAGLGVGDLCAVARALGEAQGSLAVPPGPHPPWWSRGWLWQYALSRPPGPEGYGDAGAWEHPVVVEGFGGRRHQLRERFGRLLAEAPAWRSVMASLPTTLAHLDCWAKNVVVPSSGDPVLVDWAFCGLGAVGEDPGNLVPDGFLDHFFDPGRYAEVDAAVWGAYAEGLAAARWPWPLDMARLAMCLAVLKFAWVPALMVANAGYAGPTGYGGRDGPELVEVFRRRAVVFEAMLERVEEARALTAALDGTAGWSAP